MGEKNNEYTTLTFESAQKNAKSFHPDARAILNDNHQWVYIIDTPFFEDNTLPEEFDERPSGRAHKTYVYGESELERWIRKNGYSEISIEISARIYDIQTYQIVESQKRINLKLQERGFDSIADYFNKVSSGEVVSTTALNKIRLEAVDEVKAELLPENEAVDKLQNRAYLTIFDEN